MSQDIDLGAMRWSCMESIDRDSSCEISIHSVSGYSLIMNGYN